MENTKPFFHTFFTDEHKVRHKLELFALARNARTFFCKAIVDNILGGYLLYNSFWGWKDLDNGFTPLSRKVSELIENPLEINTSLA